MSNLSNSAVVDMTQDEMRSEVRKRLKAAWVNDSRRDELEVYLTTGKEPVRGGGEYYSTKSKEMGFPDPSAPVISPEPVAPASALTPAPAGTGDGVIEALALALNGKIAASAGVDEDAVKDIVKDQLGAIDFEALITDAITALASSAAPVSAPLKAALAGSSTGDTAAHKALGRWCNPEGPIKAVLLGGPAGSGKTTVARLHGKNFEATFEVQASPDYDRTDLMGKDIPVPEDGAFGFAWADQQISAAFRSASKGIKTLLVIDEVYRLPKSTREGLLSALAPNMDGEYVLTTGRTMGVEDGVANTEVIKASKEFLAIVATTNVGLSYGISEPCPAEKERFRYVYCPTDWDFAGRLLASTASDIGWSDGDELGKKMVAIGQATENMQESCELELSASLRILAEVLTETPANDKEALVESFMLAAPIWVSRDANGKPMEAQLDSLKTVIEGIL